MKLSRERLLNFLALQPRCAVAMEACASAYDCHPRRLKGLSAGAVEECGQDGERVRASGQRDGIGANQLQPESLQARTSDMDQIRVISMRASGFRQPRLQAGWTAAPGGGCGAVLRGRPGSRRCAGASPATCRGQSRQCGRRAVSGHGTGGSVQHCEPNGATTL